MDTTIIPQGWDAALTNVALFVPKLLAFLLVLIVGYFISRWIGKLVDKGLERIGVERMVERGGVKTALDRSGYHVSDILGKVAFYTLFLFVLQMAFGVFGPNPISDLLTRVIAFLPNVFVAILIMVVAASVAAMARDLVSAALGGLSYGRWLAAGTAIAIIIVGGFMALDQLQIAPTIVTGLFYAMLAIVAGSAIIAIGGGGIQPMRNRWERALTAMDNEAPRLREKVASAAASASTTARDSEAGPYMGAANPPRPEQSR